MPNDKPKWTPGPWQKLGAEVYAPDGSLICKIHIQSGSYGPHIDANAQLIAAGTEMYEALTDWGEQLEDGSLCFCHSDTDVHTSRCLKCRSAVAKAKGDPHVQP